MGQANPSAAAASNSMGSSAPSEPQLVAVPMAFYMPMMGNVPVASPVPTNANASGSSPGIQSSLTIFPVTLLPQDVSPESPLVPPMVATASTNRAHAAAVAHGNPTTSPSTTVASIKAAQARNIARRRSRRSSSSTLTTPGGYKTLVPRTWVPQPENAHLCFVGRSPKVPSGAANDNQQIQVHSSNQTATPEVAILEDAGHTEKVPVPGQMGVSGGMANLTAEVMQKAAELPRMGDSTGIATSISTASTNDSSIAPEEPTHSQTGDLSATATSISDVDIWNDPVSMPRELNMAQATLVNFGPSDK